MGLESRYAARSGLSLTNVDGTGQIGDRVRLKYFGAARFGVQSAGAVRKEV
jgi:hypothetical protein